MRQVAMFVAGFAVVAMAGVAVAQTAIFAGDTNAVDSGYTAAETIDVPDLESKVSAPEPKPRFEQPTNHDGGAKRANEPADTEKDDPGHLEFSISTPDGTGVEVGEVTLTGTVTPGGFVWSGSHEATVDGAGNWKLTLPLVKGKNVIYVGAKLDGISTQKSVTIQWGDPLVWAIYQKVGASKIPVEKFYGTASPGMTITATSKYGTASTTAGKSGEWWLEVTFSSSPGTTFPVTVTTSTGWSKTYSFSHLGEAKEPVTRTWSINHKYATNHEPWTKFYGTGAPGTRVVATSPYGSAETEVGSTGEWFLKVWFEAPAGSAFEVTVTNSAGYHGAFQFEYVAASFEVTQIYGSCAEDPPYDVFTGRTAPHTWVKAWSEYGYAKVESNADGWFEVKVFFETAPYDVPFTVDVIDGLGNKKTFSFVRTSAES
ncbi:MAG: hypothetical protein ACLGHX_10210 [Acidimicrobiia bacterium]